MDKNENYEIERKFLIEFPDTDFLKTVDGVKIHEITQTYLKFGKGYNLRLRKRITDNVTEYFKTEKIHVTDVKRIENEEKISEKEYSELLDLYDGGLCYLTKTRYALPYRDKIVEIDIYPTKAPLAVAEVELLDENECFTLPSYINVIKEITGDNEYSNIRIAKKFKDLT